MIFVQHGTLIVTRMTSTNKATVFFQIFKSHRMFLAMASPVFEAMFFGGLSENEDVIKILDVQPDAFYVMLQ